MSTGAVDLFAGTDVAPPAPAGPCALTFELSAQAPPLDVARCSPCGWASPPAASRIVLSHMFDRHAEVRGSGAIDPT